MNIKFDDNQLDDTKKVIEELKEFTDFFIRIGIGQIDIKEDDPLFVSLLSKLVITSDMLEYFHDSMENAANNEQPQKTATHEN